MLPCFVGFIGMHMLVTPPTLECVLAEAFGVFDGGMPNYEAFTLASAFWRRSEHAPRTIGNKWFHGVSIHASDKCPLSRADSFGKRNPKICRFQRLREAIAFIAPAACCNSKFREHRDAIYKKFTLMLGSNGSGFCLMTFTTSARAADCSRPMAALKYSRVSGSGDQMKHPR